MSSSLDDPAFYDNGGEHKRHWWVHVVVAVVAMAGTITAVALADGVDDPQRGLGWLIIGVGAAQSMIVGGLVVVAFGHDAASRPPWSRFSGAASVAFATMLLPGLVLSAVIVFEGFSSVPMGPASMLYDVYGWSLLAGLTAAVACIAFRLLAPTTAEEAPSRARLLLSTMARARARLARALGDFDLVVVAVGATYLGGGAIAFIVRWIGRDHGEEWTLTSTPPVEAARLTLAFLIAALVVNVVKAKANPESLRRIGNIWDILTFWPRTFHPFAVRPYAERAVPELRRFMLAGPRNSPLVVAAHSQGTVLTYAALRPIQNIDPTTISGLVTFGSPLCSLYARGFPAYFSHADLEGVRGTLGGRWWNVFRYTDHVGRALFVTDELAARMCFAWHDGDAPLADQPVADPDAAGVVEGHNAYWVTPEVRAAVHRSQNTQPTTGDLEEVRS